MILKDAGPLACCPGSSYFWRKGQVFFWLGDTAWLMFHELTREEINDYLLNRAKKGFNVIQTVCVHHLPACTCQGRSAFFDNDLTRPDTLGKDSYWSLVDWTVSRARELGLYLALVPHWGNLVNQVEQKDMLNYIDFLARRYACKDNILWLTGGDVRGDDHEAYWQAMGQRIKEICPDQLVSFHPFGRTSSLDFFPDASWMDFHMFQSGHRRYDQQSLDSWDDTQSRPYYGEDNWRYVREGRSLGKIMPILDGEPSYEHIPQGLHIPSQPYWTPAQVRRYGWWSVLSGAGGFTYGHNSIMQFYKGTGQGAFFVHIPWRDALHGPGGMCAAIMGRFMESLLNREVKKANTLGKDPVYWIQKHFFPCEDILTGPSQWEEDQKEERVIAFLAGSVILCYTWVSQPISIEISGKWLEKFFDSLLDLHQNPISFEAWWMDPSSGEESRIGLCHVPGPLTFTPPAGDFDHTDWLLLLKAPGEENPMKCE